jgi:adenine-specific DNA-methyltransferase
MPAALEKLVQSVQAETIILSYNDDSWLSREDLVDMCRVRGDVALLEFDFKRYVGSQIGIYNKKGERVGTPGRARNREWMLIAGERDRVRKMAAATQTQSITFA